MVLPKTTRAQSDPSIYEKYEIYRNPITVFLNKFTWSLTTGYLATKHKFDTDGWVVVQTPDGHFFNVNSPEVQARIQDDQEFRGFINLPILPRREPTISLENQYSIPTPRLENPVNNPLLRNGIVIDSTGVVFRGYNRGIPINASLHYEFKKFRVGLGIMAELQYYRNWNPLNRKEELRAYKAPFARSIYRRFYGLVGYKFWTYSDYAFVGDIKFGTIKSNRSSFEATITRSQYVNVGVTIERNFSEYFRIIARPHIEYKRYTVNFLEGLRVNTTTFGLTVGASYNIPEIPRSPIKSDHVQLKHVITDPKTGRKMEVRGQPFYKHQNPKTGQNDRKLLKYKGRNKKKIHPY